MTSYEQVGGEKSLITLVNKTEKILQDACSTKTDVILLPSLDAFVEYAILLVGNALFKVVLPEEENGHVTLIPKVTLKGNLEVIEYKSCENIKSE